MLLLRNDDHSSHSFVDQRFGVLSVTQRIDYFWSLGYVRVKNVCL